jgi:hypothetical protein
MSGLFYYAKVKSLRYFIFSYMYFSALFPIKIGFFVVPIKRQEQYLKSFLFKDLNVIAALNKDTTDVLHLTGGCPLSPKCFGNRNNFFCSNNEKSVGVRNDVICRTIFEFYKEFHNIFV